MIMISASASWTAYVDKRLGQIRQILRVNALSLCFAGLAIWWGPAPSWVGRVLYGVVALSVPVTLWFMVSNGGHYYHLRKAREDPYHTIPGWCNPLLGRWPG